MTSAIKPVKPVKPVEAESNDLPVGQLIVDRGHWRIVEVQQGGCVVNTVLEVRDGLDAMGAEKWRLFIINSKTLQELFQYTVELANIVKDYQET